MPIISDFYQTVDLCLVVGCAPARPRDRRLHREAAGQPRPDRYRSDGQRPHLCQPVFRLRRRRRRRWRGCSTGIEGKHADRPGLSAGFAAAEARRRRRNSSARSASTARSASSCASVMPQDAIWVRDVTQNNTTWGNRIFPLNAPHQNVYPVGAGIGQGLSPRHRRGGRGERPQDRGHDRRWRLLPECRRAVDRGAGEARSQSSSS